MSDLMLYEINKAKFIFEHFDQETVLVNLENGYYYSLSDSGAEILNLLEQGLTRPGVCRALTADSDEEGKVRELTIAFIDRLAMEGIIVRRTSNNPATSEAAGCQPSDSSQRRANRFVEPSLTRFDDMQELLLLDPIHQVDERFGWPNQ